MTTHTLAALPTGLPWRSGMGVAVGVSLAVHAGLLSLWLWGTAASRADEPVVLTLAAQARSAIQEQWLAVARTGADRADAHGSAPSRSPQGGVQPHEASRRPLAPTPVRSVAGEAKRQGTAVRVATPAAGALSAAAGASTEAPEQAAVDDERGAGGMSSAPPTVAAEPARPVGPQPLPGNTLPGYPLAAREDGLEGRVLLRVQIDPTGAVGEVAIVQRSGVNLLDQTARDAVRAWRFRPAHDGRAAVPSSLQLAIRFSLREPAPRMELALAGAAR